ncbi:unnamed protein product [Adineta steineri]|uniref:Uncharacterized protein n=1 Tax=Adineta steineri TaxID=433720 RepID=A0A819YLD5_9BILA|nr:unnamed protein product [Adineta steineri]CAF4155195.1 unnamed protein product [Adineta steineri]
MISVFIVYTLIPTPKITQNIFRETANAYKYDNKARRTALSLLETFTLSDLFIPFLLTYASSSILNLQGGPSQFRNFVDSPIIANTSGYLTLLPESIHTI